MNLSKSKYCKGIQCKKQLWLDKYRSEYREDGNNQSILENGTQVGELARGLLGRHVVISFDEDLSKMIEDTKRELEKEDNIICEASFNYKNNFCSVDILKKEKDEYEIYEVKSSTEIEDIYLDDAGYQYYVLSNLGLKIRRVCLVYINNKYIRKGDIELDKLFIIEDISKIVKDKYLEVEDNIKKINNYMEIKEEREEGLDIHCFKPYPCPYFNYCHKLEKPNVFDIAGMSVKNKIKLYKKGKYLFKDLINEEIDSKYLEQIDYELNDKKDKIMDKEIDDFLREFTYPLYFLDFESYQVGIPPYDEIRPYMQIPFQYSLHYLLEEKGELKHKEFLAEAGRDPRRELAEALCRDIPKDTCVLAYNMSFEKGRIRELAEIYPDLREHLLNIESNIKDLMIPFRNRWYYSKEMKGSYSIKYVLPALYPNDEELNYHNLPIVHNGSEASSTFISLCNDIDNLKEIREGLLKYCGLDTLAMVKVYEKLKKDRK